VSDYNYSAHCNCCPTTFKDHNPDLFADYLLQLEEKIEALEKRVVELEVERRMR